MNDYEDFSMLPTVEKIKGEQIKLSSKLLKIQERCHHPDKELECTPHADTGNWSSTDDRYWYKFHCHRCDKYWITDQTNNYPLSSRAKWKPTI